jgi:hypothetical protein
LVTSGEVTASSQRFPQDRNMAHGKLAPVLWLIGFAVLSRLVPHPPNFAGVAAAGLFAGAFLPLHRAWLVPVAAMAIADGLGQLLGLPGVTWYQPELMVAVYASMGVSSLIGAGLLRRHRQAWRVGSAAVAASLLFYLASNFAIWAGTSMYEPSAAGLVTCYGAGLPFLAPTLAGDLIFSATLFGVAAWAGVADRARIPAVPAR